MWFMQKVIVALYQSTYITGSDFYQNSKKLNFGLFFGLLGPSWPAMILFQKLDFVMFLT